MSQQTINLLKSTSVTKNLREQSVVKMKLLTAFLVIFLPEVLSGALEPEKTFLTQSHSPLFYLSRLIEDWNQKHPEISNIVVFNIGQNKETLENVLKIIPKDNPVVITDPKQCKICEHQKAAFVIFVTKDFNNVSYFFEKNLV